MEKWCNGVHAGVMIHVMRRDIKGSIPFLLTIQRKGDDGEGQWSVPGGWIDNGEDPIESALRELAEEMGDDLEVENVSFSNVTNDIHPEGTHSVTLHYYADWKSGNPVIAEPDKMIGWKWTNIREVESMDLFKPCRNYYHRNVV